jgi:excisionase family DNA binding protein
MNKVYTTTEVANILQVSNRKVTQWIDDNVLKGFRLPQSLHRRVMHDKLVEFMAEYGYPSTLLNEAVITVPKEEITPLAG